MVIVAHKLFLALHPQISHLKFSLQIVFLFDCSLVFGLELLQLLRGQVLIFDALSLLVQSLDLLLKTNAILRFFQGLLIDIVNLES